MVLSVPETINILLVDDETLARARMRRFLEEGGVACEIREARHGAEALNEISRKLPDIMFLDVQMPGMNGFDVLFQLPDRDFPVVFQTAFDEYALRAFDVAAADYLLKPFTADRFFVALERARERASRPQLLQETRHAASAQGLFMHKIRVETSRGDLLIGVEEVDYLYSSDHYTVVVVDGQEYLTSVSLARLEEALDPTRFLRVHRKSIIRLDAVRGLQRGDRVRVLLTSGAEVEVARRKVANVKSYLQSRGEAGLRH